MSTIIIAQELFKEGRVELIQSQERIDFKRDSKNKPMIVFIVFVMHLHDV